jgi:NAD(P)-dependent dehydrogenase (short-subunit alcohol dehydrogenase family)
MAQKGWLLITGGSRGIGAATARLAAQQGYDTVITYVSRADDAADVIRDVKALGQQAISVAVDVSDEEQVLDLFGAVDALDGPLVGLVNNAAVLDQQMRLDEMSAARIQRILAVNVLGAFLCTRETVKRLSTKYGGNGGCIVNVSSMASRLGSPNEYIDYAASKGAVDAMTIGLSKEVANEGIRVNGVRPGLIYTEMHASGGEAGRVERLQNTVPMGRGGQPEEVANAIMWFLSDASSYATGAFIDVAGGR